jgi:hypothetical protein
MPENDAEPQDVIRRFVYALLPHQAYPRALPDELAPWYCATADGGHCIAVVVQSAAGEEIDPDRCLVALPVKTVVRVGWNMRDGYVVCDVPYGSSGARGVEEDDEEFDGLTINT